MILTMALVVDRYVLGAAQENCYAVRVDRGAAEAAVIDPGDGAAQLRLELAGMGALCAGILITHCHWDHLMGVADLAEGTGYLSTCQSSSGRCSATPRVLPRHSAPALRRSEGVSGGHTVDVAGIAFEVVSIPGHSPGHVAYYAEAASFRRPALRRVGRPHGSAVLRLGNLAGVDPHALRALPTGNRRLSGPRP